VFKAKIENARLWKNLLSAISTLIEEADFNTSEDGIKLRAMDPSHVAMVDFTLEKKAFDEYHCDKSVSIRINIDSMLRLLRRIKSNETLELAFNEDTKKMILTLKEKITKQFTIPTLNPTGEQVPTPKVTFNCKIKMAIGGLKEIMEDMQAVSDHVKLEAKENKLLVSASSELSSANIEVDKQSDILLDTEFKESALATYNLNYLTEMVKAGSALSETATVEFSTNMPIKIEFEISQKGKLAYYLAPRIEVE
jgi:proliferating cell nuclear antigen